MATTNIFKTTGVKGAYPDAQSFAPEEAIPEALCLDERIATPTVLIEGDAPRVNIPYVDTNPTAGIVAEGDEISPSEGSLNQIQIATHKVGLMLPFTNESLAYADATALLTEGATRAMIDKVDTLLLSAAADTPTGTPAGIANLTGITAETPTTLTDLSPILTVLSEMTNAGANPTALVMRFSTWARLMALTATDGRPLIAPDVTTAATPMLFSVPVIFNTCAPENTVLAISAKDVIVSCSKLETATSVDAWFSRDSSVMRLTMRFGFGVVHPERLGKVVLPTK